MKETKGSSQEGGVRPTDSTRMKEFSSQDLQRRIGVVQEAALVEPIAITFHGRRRHVMMSMDQFERLQRVSEPRVYRLSELPDELLQQVADSEMGTEHAHLDSELSSSPSKPRG